MSDANFRPGSSTSYGTGSARPGSQHPLGSGRSYEAERRMGSARQRSYMDQASDMADDAWRAGREYYEQGSGRIGEWADEHPNQLWAAIAIAGAFALWMAYRPILSSNSRRHFDASRYRYRRLPRPSGRAGFMEGGPAGDRSAREF